MSKREDIFEKLDNLIEQNQFELVSDKVDDNRLKVIYLMNDAVESFIVFENARITGEYIKDYQGEINTSLTVQKNDSTGNDEYVLVVHQKDSVCTVFFEDVSFEVNLYNYGRTAHFWIEGYECLRQLEYKISILRDKLDYLGEKYCNDLEKELANLTDFPPLNYCFYPSVPEKYLVPRDNPWEPTDKAISVMLKVAREQQDKMLYQVLVLYKQFKNRKLAKVIATMLHRKSHGKVVESLMEKMTEATKNYPTREFGKTADNEHKKILTRAKQLQNKLKHKKIKSEIFVEEPFVVATDSIEYKVYLMIWKKSPINTKVEIQEIK